MKIIQRFLLSIVFGLSLTTAVRAEWDEWMVDTELTFSAEDNINHSINNALTKNDQVWNSYASAGRFYHLSGYTRLDISTQVEVRAHHQYSGLNQIKSGLTLGVRHKFGLGPYQPRIKSSVSSNYIFSRSKIREGYQTHVDVELGKLIHERIDIVFNYHFDHRISRNGNAISIQKLNVAGFDFVQQQSSSVYDLTGHTIGLQLNTALTEQLFLNLKYAYREGDIVSTTNPSNASIYETVIDAIVNDDALPGWAYRLDGITHTYSVDASYAFMKGDASINLGYQHTEANADSFTYRNNLFRINFNYAF